MRQRRHSHSKDENDSIASSVLESRNLLEVVRPLQQKETGSMKAMLSATARAALVETTQLIRHILGVCARLAGAGTERDSEKTDKDGKR